VLFGAPHLWWALGVRTGFPGGDESYESFMGRAWRYAFEVLVVLLSAVMEGRSAVPLIRRAGAPLSTARC
jgi:hypothetical protein